MSFWSITLFLYIIPLLPSFRTRRTFPPMVHSKKETPIRRLLKNYDWVLFAWVEISFSCSSMPAAILCLHDASSGPESLSAGQSVALHICTASSNKTPAKRNSMPANNSVPHVTVLSKNTFMNSHIAWTQTLMPQFNALWANFFSAFSLQSNMAEANMLTEKKR